MKVKEESEKVGLKFNIQKMKIMASGPITSWQTDGETMETVTDFLFFFYGKIFNNDKWVNLLKDIIIFNDCVSSNKASKYTEKNLTELKGEIDKYMLYLEISTLLSQ